MDMKHLKYLSFSALTALLIISACKSNDSAVNASSCNSCEDAVIRYFGDPALDGCGWVVDVASTIYMPSNLAPQFHIDSLKVQLKYTVKERVNCGMLKDAYPSISIEEIQKR
jgi:hypothetical protein